MTVTVGKRIPANYSGLITPRSWTAGDGLQSYTNATIGGISGGTPHTNFMVYTDASGNIVNWYFYVESVTANNGVLWAVRSNNMPLAPSGTTIAQAVDYACGGFAESTKLGIWITP